MLAIIEFLKRFAPMLRSGKMSYADALTRFKAQFGRPADGLELSSIRKEVEKAPSNVFDLTGKQIDTSRPIIGGKNVANDVDGIINNLKSMEPMDAMKEANLIVGRKGQYKNLSIDESQKILKDTNDHIFSRDIQYDEFGDPIKPDPDDFASGGLARVGMFGGKLTIDALRKLVTKKYAGKIDDDLLQKMLVDDDPQRLSEVMATIDEALIMQNKGMKPDAIMDTFKESFKRKKQASGGLAKILGV